MPAQRDARGRFIKGSGGSTPKPNQSVLDARARRATKDAKDDVRIEWKSKEVARTIAVRMRKRVIDATAMLKDKVIRNISRPVTKSTGPRGGRVVTSRSKPGEFPRADTIHLLKTIFDEVRETSPDVWDGFVGTPLDYGLILETRMNRSFLVRTLNENKGRLIKIIAGPMT